MLLSRMSPTTIDALDDATDRLLSTLVQAWVRTDAEDVDLQVGGDRGTYVMFMTALSGDTITGSRAIPLDQERLQGLTLICVLQLHVGCIIARAERDHGRLQLRASLRAAPTRQRRRRVAGR